MNALNCSSSPLHKFQTLTYLSEVIRPILAEVAQKGSFLGVWEKESPQCEGRVIKMLKTPKEIIAVSKWCVQYKEWR